MPKINGNEIRPGYVLQHKGKIWRVLKTDHVKPGKGGAFAQVEMKSLTDISKLNERFRSSEAVERVQLEQRDFQFLYAEGESILLMDIETFEQMSLPKDRLSEAEQAFLTEGMIVKLELYDAKALSIALPESVTLEVVEADPVIKGQTVTSSYKPAILENGRKVMVPPHIEVGMRIRVATATEEYMERAKD